MLKWGKPNILAGQPARLRFARLTVSSRTPKLTLIMYAITAHVAALNVGTNGAPASGLVGRISSASEGSVSVSVDLAVPKGAEWWGQTKYGFSAYQMLAPFRQFRYFVPGRCRW